MVQQDLIQYSLTPFPHLLCLQFNETAYFELCTSAKQYTYQII